MPTCAKCRKEYGEEFDGCPHCARSRVAYWDFVRLAVAAPVLYCLWAMYCAPKK